MKLVRLGTTKLGGVDPRTFQALRDGMPDLGDVPWREIPGYLALADAYVDDTIDQPRALLAVSLSDAGTKVTTWRMPVADEDGTGIWHRRYYLDGTIMARAADGETGFPT